MTRDPNDVMGRFGDLPGTTQDDLLARLLPLEYEALTLRFGLKDNAKHTKKEVAQQMGLKLNRAEAIITSTLTKLKAWMDAM